VYVYIYKREIHQHTTPKPPKTPPKKERNSTELLPTYFLLPTFYSITVSSNDDFEINTVENDKIDAASGSVWTGL